MHSASRNPNTKYILTLKPPKNCRPPQYSLAPKRKNMISRQKEENDSEDGYDEDGDNAREYHDLYEIESHNTKCTADVPMTVSITILQMAKVY